MFPENFVADKIATYTQAGDVVLDPFVGRGTTVLQALLMNRRAIGIDINPVAYCIAAAKASLPNLDEVMSEVGALQDRYAPSPPDMIAAAVSSNEEFFSLAFSPQTLSALVFLRGVLNWRHDHVHRFIAALVLGILHGEHGRSSRYLSNQLPRTISPKPAYSVRWWLARNSIAPHRDVFRALEREAHFRLSQEPPSLGGEVVLGDARDAAATFPHHQGAVRLVVTSPPYLDTTNYEEDQWLRRWFLGGPSSVTYHRVSKDDRHENPTRYWAFVQDTMRGLCPLLAPDAVLVVRIGGTRLDEADLVAGFQAALHGVLPNAKAVGAPVTTAIPRRQTDSFRPGSRGCRFEVDFTFRVDGGVT
jgi:hypothetical protein